jgi:hypothetical protein
MRSKSWSIPEDELSTIRSSTQRSVHPSTSSSTIYSKEDRVYETNLVVWYNCRSVVKGDEHGGCRQNGLINLQLNHELTSPPQEQNWKDMQKVRLTVSSTTLRLHTILHNNLPFQTHPPSLYSLISSKPSLTHFLPASLQILFSL